MFDALHGISLLRIAAATAALQIDAKSPLRSFKLSSKKDSWLRRVARHRARLVWASDGFGN